MSSLTKRIERLEVGHGPGPEFLFVDRTVGGRFIDDATGKDYRTVGEVVDAKGLDRDRTIAIHWES